MQEALLGLWRAPERFDPSRGSLATFLLTLTHRRAVDVLRREALQRRGRVASDEGLAELPSRRRGHGGAGRGPARRRRRARGAQGAARRRSARRCCSRTSRATRSARSPRSPVRRSAR